MLFGVFFCLIWILLQAMRSGDMHIDSIRLARGQNIEDVLEPLQGTEEFGILPGDGGAHVTVD
jgi:hypothetical protein